MSTPLRLRPISKLPEDASISPADCELLAQARHQDIASVLGLQAFSGHAVLRCWVCGGEAVSVISEAFATDGADSKVELRRASGLGCAPWLFEAVFEVLEGNLEAVRRSGWSHELHIQYTGGGEATWRDPWSQGHLLSEASLKAWTDGNPSESPASMFGAHHMECRPGVWGTRFAVWAPCARAVSVVGDFNFWDGRSHPMCRRDPFGVWELCIPVWDLRGQKYGYQVLPQSPDGQDLGAEIKTDPFALEFVDPSDGGHDAKVSQCDDYSRKAWKGTFAWGDDAWLRHRAQAFGPASWASQPLAIYEVHLASWGAQRSYRDIAEPLSKYVEEMGFNAVEFLPVTQYPNEASWGYQCAAGLYAVDSRLGTPDDFRHLVNALHERSIAVFVDFVGAHFAKDSWGLVRYAGAPQFEYEGALGELPQWGTARYDFSKPEVRAYLAGAAWHWVEHFHVDGLRLDAVAAMAYRNFGREEDGDAILAGKGVRNEDGISFLRQLCACMREKYPGVLMMAEESTNFKWVTSRPLEEGTERQQVQMEDLGFHLKWNMGFSYDTLDFMRTEHSRRAHLETFGCKKLAWYLAYAFNERWVLPFSHDNAQPKGLLEQTCAPSEVDRKGQFAQLGVLLAYTVGMPGRPLLFQGTEVGEEAWSYKSPIDWAAVQADPLKQRLQCWVKRLLHLYRELPALHCEDDGKRSFAWLDKDSADRCVFAWLRSAKAASDVIVLLNFSTSDVGQYHVAAAPGKWRCVASMAMAEDGGCESEERIADVPANGAQLRTDLPAVSAQFWLASKVVTVKLDLELRHPQAASDADVRVVGDCLELGEWRPEAAAALGWDEEAKAWRCQVEVAASRGRVEFKYIVLAPDRSLTWEPIDGNRTLSLTGQEVVHVAAEFGRAG